MSCEEVRHFCERVDPILQFGDLMPLVFIAKVFNRVASLLETGYDLIRFGYRDAWVVSAVDYEQRAADLVDVMDGGDGFKESGVFLQAAVFLLAVGAPPGTGIF